MQTFTHSVLRNKYYDKYSTVNATNFNNRILGDATGEMGTFGSEQDPNGTTSNKSSWYGDYAYFARSSSPWFVRGGGWYHGSGAGVFAFSSVAGGTDANISFRVVLAP